MAIESNSQYLERLEKYLNKKKRNESFLVGKLKEWKIGRASCRERV